MKGFVIALAVVAGAAAAFFLRAPAPRPPAAVAEVDRDGLVVAESAAVLARTTAKERLYDRLAAGDVALADAVREFLALNREWPAVPPERYDRYSGRSLGARAARRIVEFVRVRLAGDRRRDEVLGRLTCELTVLDDWKPGWEFAPLAESRR